MKPDKPHHNNIEALSIPNLLGLSEKELVVFKGIYLDMSLEQIASILDADEKQFNDIVDELVEKGYLAKSGFWIFKSIHLTEKGHETLILYEAGKIAGTVKWFVGSKGYGYITLVEKNMDFFFHVSDVVGVEIPKNKDRVAFKPVKTSKGLRALQVEILEKFEGEDRVRCPDCGKLVVPRLITYKGEPEKSVCPFCGETIRSFWTISIF